MSKRRAVLGLFVVALVAAPLFGQPPAAGPEPLPAGARLRLGSAGLAAGAQVSVATLSADGKYLAIAGRDGVTLFDRVSGKRLVQVRDNGPLAGGLFSIALAPKGDAIAYGTFRGLVLADAATGKPRQPLAINVPGFQHVQGLTFSADGSVVAAGMRFPAGNQKLRAFAWEVATGKAWGPFEVEQNQSCATALSPDGKQLATWGRHYPRPPNNNDREPAYTVQLWDVAAGKELRKLKLLSTQISAAAFAPDGKTLAVASGLSTFHLFDLATGQERRRFAGRRGHLALLEFSPDGKLLVAGNADGSIQAWHAGSGARLELPAGPKGQLLAVAFPGAGQIIALGMVGQTVDWWDVLTGQRRDRAPSHHMPVLAVAFTADGRTLRSVSFDGEVLSWDPATGTLRRQLSLVDDDMLRLGGNLGLRFNSLAVSADARLAASCNIYSNHGVRLWDLAKGQVVCDFEPSKPGGGSAFGLAFTGRGDRLAAAGTSSRLVSLWDCGRGEEVGTLTYAQPGNPLGGSPPRIALAPDGKQLAVIAAFIDPVRGMTGARLQLLDTAHGKEAATVELAPGNFGGFGGGVALAPPLAFSLDSQRLALPGPNRQVILLHTATGSEDRRLASSGAGAVTALAFAPDRRTLAVAYGGQPAFHPNGLAAGMPAASLEVWELATGKLRASYAGHHGAVNCLAFAPDGLTLASGGADATVLLWDVVGLHGHKPAALTDKEVQAAWTSLAEPDAQAAFGAQRRLILSPAETIAFLKRELPPAAAPDVDTKQIDAWVKDLDSDAFASRDEAYRALAQVGVVAESALRKARAGNPSLETRRRIDQLLRVIERGSLSSAEVRAVRAVEVLERIATPDARTLLDAWAAGAPTAVLTREARTAVARLRP